MAGFDVTNCKFWKNMCITSTALVFRLLSDFCPTGRGQSIENTWWNWAFARVQPSLPKGHQMLQPPCRCKPCTCSGRSLLHETVRTSCIMSGCRLSIIQTPSSKCSGSCGALSWMVKILRANGYYHIYAWQWHVLRSAATESQAKMPPKKTVKGIHSSLTNAQSAAHMFILTWQAKLKPTKHLHPSTLPFASFFAYEVCIV